MKVSFKRISNLLGLLILMDVVYVFVKAPVLVQPSDPYRDTGISIGAPSADVAILDLLPWERETSNSTLADAMQRLREQGHVYLPRDEEVMKYCALGVSSTGDGVYQRTQCFRSSIVNRTTGLSVYDRVRERVQQMFSNANSSVCDVCKIMEHFHNPKNHIHTLTFWGDSMQQQVYFGFLCELARRNYRVQRTVVHRNATDGALMTLWDLRRIDTVKIKYPQWKRDDFVTLKFFFQYKPKPLEELYNETMRHILEAETDVLMFNFGLHWGAGVTQTFSKHLQYAIESLNRYGRNISLILFRETSAQHFDTEKGIGEYMTGVNKSHCVPHSHPSNRDIGWRLQRVVLIWRMTNYFRPVYAYPNQSSAPAEMRDHHSVGILPFFKFSSEFHDLHPTECTHYCHTPFFWMPIWRSIRLSMDARFGG